MCARDRFRPVSCLFSVRMAGRKGAYAHYICVVEKQPAASTHKPYLTPRIRVKDGCEEYSRIFHFKMREGSCFSKKFINMSEVQVSESNNTSAIAPQKRQQRPARSRMSVTAAMPITNKKRHWPAGQADEEEDEEEGDLALQQQATSGPTQSPPLDSSESVSACLTDIISGILKQTETAMEDLLPTINEIDTCSLDIKEQLNQKRDMAMDRRARLEQTRERFQQTASSVLEMLNLTAPLILESGLRDETGA